jgi:hypothetical protein
MSNVKLTNKKKTRDQFIFEAIKIHNNLYDYSLVHYINNYTKIQIICTKHGIFDQTPTNHLIHKRGCSVCTGNKKKTTSEFIEQSNKKHNFKYDYSKTILVNMVSDVTIICSIHGDYTIRVSDHLHKMVGCNKCSQKYKYTTDEFIKLAQSIHNNKYLYTKTKYVQSHEHIIITCVSHGDFLLMPTTHLQGVGCGRCKLFISKPETEWLNWLNVPNSSNNRQIKLKINGKRIKVDGFIPETNTIYEFWGDYWHGNPTVFDSNKIHPVIKITYQELLDRTNEKRKLITSAGYNLVDIWENDWNRIKQQKVSLK